MTDIKISNIKITNPDKILYKKDKIKKIDIIKYYEDISSLMLPYLKNRLLAVIRCHQGINDNCFFKKHPTTDGDNVEIFNLDSEEYFYIKNKSQLINQAQLGTIEFHPWPSTINKIDKPNFMIFDLDPATNLEIEKIRQGALNLKSVLDELNLKSFIKTSGGKGYHIVVPFSSCKNWDRFSEFSMQIARLMEMKWPKLYTTNIRKSERKNKIFIDYLRNKKGSTCVCAYSLRARDGASISMPIDWDDINKITPNEVNINNYKNYISKNPWKDIFSVKQTLK